MSAQKRKSSGNHASASKRKPAKAKHQQGLYASVFSNNNDKFHKSMEEKYVGKRVLLTAKSVYNRNIPRGEEDYLFQYSVVSVDKCNFGDKAVTAILEYGSKFIAAGGNKFQNYPHTGSNTSDDLMDGYRLTLFNHDHEEYNKYLGITQREINNQKDLIRRKEETAKVRATDDCSDIERAIKANEVEPHQLFVNEFEPVGELEHHIISKGPSAGDTKMKQTWKHKHSTYSFTWHHQNNKEEFEKCKLKKVVDLIIAKEFPGYIRLARISKWRSSIQPSKLDEKNGKLKKSVDLNLRVLAVIAAVSCKCPLSIFENFHFKQYVNELNPGHRLPYRLERVRILEVLIDLAMHEFTKILKERRNELGEEFLSAQTDMWKDPHRKEHFGALVVSMVARSYSLDDGRQLFMSEETAKMLHDQDALISDHATLSVLEYVANFEKFEGAKSIENVTKWMLDSCNHLGILNSDFNQFCADGASNSIGSIAELEASSRTERSNNVDVTICIAHQNQRSIGYASGTIDFAKPVNTELGEVLHKSHDIQYRMYRSDLRTSTLRAIQRRKRRDPLLGPMPANDTRWDTVFAETRRSNIIMDDVSDALDTLLAVGGADYDMLECDEKSSDDHSRLVYTEKDKMILRQYEGAATFAQSFSKFTQDNSDNAWSYVLFELRLVIERARWGFFTMYSDHSSHKATEDLRDRGRKDIHVLDPDNDKFTHVEFAHVDMDETIVTFLKTYGDDLERRVGIGRDVEKLPHAFGAATLLNPLFGLKPLITTSGLMSVEQYDHARRDILNWLQDLHEATSARIHQDSSEDDHDSRDGSNPFTPASMEYANAKAELELFESYKRVRYHPKEYRSGSGGMTLGDDLSDSDDDGDGGMSLEIGGDVTKEGRNLPSGKNLAHYIDKKGRFGIMRFFEEHKNIFPKLFVIVQRMASRQVTEVGCERFFSLSGYISAPRRTRLHVRTYERLAMLSTILRTVYVDPKAVADEYTRRCAAKAWKSTQTEDALKCWNLERIIEAEMLHAPLPAQMTMRDFLDENVEQPNLLSSSVIVLD